MTMATESGTATQASIHPDTAMGAVSLTVSDLARSRDFYERAIGLTATERDDGSLALSAGAVPLVSLYGDSSAPPLNRHATGLFHQAILVPSRRDLAQALVRLARARWPLDGASDHLVSEALYLSDPDGNGIEIYRDRPREEWRRTNDGQLEMATIPLDLDGVLAELDGETSVPALMPAGTTIGHVHLQVSDLAAAEAFYNRVLGFDVIVRGYPGALFVSAGGYHHHLGLNTWHSAGAAPAEPGSVGLRSYEVRLPDERELATVLARVHAAGIPAAPSGDGATVRDPSGNAVVLRAAPVR
jgi:catechol 2,3-dioxygenase